MRSSARLIAAVTCLAGTGVIGCNGSGKISIVPTGLRKLRTTDPLLRTVHADRCFYWIEAKPPVHSALKRTTDKQGRLCIAMTASQLPFIVGSPNGSIELSLVLGPPPTSDARNYRINRSGLRMVHKDGYKHERWASLSGIVSVQLAKNGVLCGRFRIAAKQQKFLITMGWTGSERTLLVGEFQAVYDQDQGQGILEETERNGMARTSAK